MVNARIQAGPMLKACDSGTPNFDTLAPNSYQNFVSGLCSSR